MGVNRDEDAEERLGVRWLIHAKTAAGIEFGTESTGILVGCLLFWVGLCL